MKNNTLGKIEMMTAKLPKEEHNWSHDVNTTCDFGSVHPVECKYSPAGTKHVISTEEKIYLAPVVAHTFGRLSAKLYHQFVPYSDLFPNWFKSLMSQEAYASAISGRIRPINDVAVSVKLLSSFMLFGAKLSIWYGGYTEKSTSANPDPVTTPDTKVYALYKNNAAGGTTNWMYTALNTHANGFWSRSGGYGNNLQGKNNAFFSCTGGNRTADFADPALNAFGCKAPAAADTGDGCVLFNANTFFNIKDDNRVLIPIGNPSFESFAVDSFYGTNINYARNIQAYGFDDKFYNPEESDVVITREVVLPYTDSGTTKYRNYRFYFCFHLSDFGKRYKKFLEGCGIRPCFVDNGVAPVAPLLAAYKAYYDLFSINLYDHFEDSILGYACQQIDQGAVFGTNGNDFCQTCDTNMWLAQVFAQFGQSFYTDEQDYFSAHIRNTGVSPSTPLSNNQFIDVGTGGYYGDGTPVVHVSSIDDTATTGTNPLNAHAAINDVRHGQLDSEYLKILYRWVNRNTVLGQRVADLLRAQGLGDYVDNCKSNFVGYQEAPIIFEDVISASDTYNESTDEGSLLGQRGAKAIGYNDGKKVFTFENNDIGFMVSLLVIVPKAGYGQGDDMANRLLIGKNQHYLPDFDALGYEATQMLALAAPLKDDGTARSLGHSKTFGLIPRMSRFKVNPNKMMGDFTCSGSNKGILPYTFDKYMPVNEMQCRNDSHVDSAGRSADVFMPLYYDDVPTCGPIWRFLGKNPAVENFTRIFANRGYATKLSSYMVGNSWSEFITSDKDNFIVQMIVNYRAYAPMKSLEKSFETDDDGKTNTAMEKA